MIRIDNYPTHECNGIKFRIGKVLPYGASIVSGGVNFSVFSRYAEGCTLVLFHKGEKEPYAEIPFPDEFRIGDVFSMIVFDVNYEELEYGFRMKGKFAPEEGFRFDESKILSDPYAKAVSGRNVWGKEPDFDDIYQHRSRVMFDDFDWQGDKQLEIPMNDLIIYETHVRSFTMNSSCDVKHRGTYAGILEKADYLNEIGVNCIELLPIFEFDEFENSRKTEKGRLYNYWGYSTVAFFAPKAGYAASGKYGMEADELKNLIKNLHKRGIEVILDVVFNHTAEGNEQGPYISYRGIDNKTYYLLTPEGYYYNFSGCGNTLNCNNPIVRSCILDCLRYWVSEYHIDGFRFDLASILSRDEKGAPMTSPPLLEVLANDAVLSRVKLIAEAWDAGGLYQVGSFPSWGRWAEWNGRYRDTVRAFLKSDSGVTGEFMQRFSGSADMYGNRSSNASINFVTCHDGFTLADMVSYNDKHNLDNGEENRDGANDNRSWNCGAEGETDNADIISLRHRQIKNALVMLLTSRGIPMVLSGDEFGNTQYGNNNAYCQDNEISWLDWSLVKKNSDISDFFKAMTALRNEHPVMRASDFYNGNNKTGYPELSWHGVRAWNVDDPNNALCIAAMYVEEGEKFGTGEDVFIYIAFNMHWEEHTFELPVIPEGKTWKMYADTSSDKILAGKGKALDNQSQVTLGARSCAVLIGKK